MGKISYLLGGLALLLAVSCNKESKIVYSENPVKAISVTSGTETVAGVVSTTEKTINFTFNNAEDFSSCDVTLELNEGWTLNYPTELKGVNLQDTPVFRFADHNNAVVRYTVDFSSNAFPIVDASKIQVKGLNAGEAITVDNTTKTISIKFNEETMDFNNIELVFNEGALQNGVVLPENLIFDFAQGNSHELIFKLGGDRVYKVVLDVTAYVTTTPEQMGFMDVSSNFVNADQSYIKVYSAAKIANVPVFLLESADWSNWAGSWIKGGGWPSENAWYNGNNAGDDLYAFPGDWASDRPTMNCFGNIAIVTVDAGKVAADLKSASNGVDPTSVNSAVVTSGWVNKHESQVSYLVRDNGTTVNTPESGCEAAYRSSVLVKDGVVSLATAGEKADGFYVIPFQSELPDVNAILNAANEKIEAPDIAWVQAWGVRDGKAMGYNDYINNDGTQYMHAPGVFGMGYEGIYRVRNLVGTTYDGKLAFMINEGGAFSGDGVGGLEHNGYSGYADDFRFKGYSLKQLLWIAQKLGWRNAAVLGSVFEEVSSTFCPSLLVNGKSVIESLTPTNTTYVLAVDAK